MKSVRRVWYQALILQNHWLERAACNAMQWRGFADRAIHPKHLFDEMRASYLSQQFRSGMRFLDIGSGEGTDCLAAARHGASKVVGVEGNPESVKAARRRALEEDCSNIEFVELDLENGALPFEDDSFDLINFSNVLEHIENRAALLSEIVRVKTGDGEVVMSVPNSQTTWKKRLRAAGVDSRDDPEHKIEYSRDELRAELSYAGLDIQSPLMPIVPSFPWHGVLALTAAISPGWYRKSQRYKRRLVDAKPDESTGWVFSAI